MTRYTVAEEIAEKPIPEQRSHVLKTGTPRSFVALRSTTSPMPPQRQRALIVPMPKSWSKAKREQYVGQPHQQKPDKDNLEKALLDAVFDEDSHVWDGRVTKIWGETGQIIIGEAT